MGNSQNTLGNSIVRRNLRRNIRRGASVTSTDSEEVLKKEEETSGKPDNNLRNAGTEDSVLTEELLVRGTTNLYVADASAIPRIPNGNVHSTVVVVASMALEFLVKRLQFISTLL
jgi:hypothetical protein